MANIIQRVLKGSPLTLQEHDDNFNNLNAELATKATAASVDAQVTSAVSAEAALRSAADAAEITNRDTAIASASISTLASARTYTDTNIATEITNRTNSISSAVSALKGGVSTDGDTLAKLRSLISGSNSGTNTGDETAETIRSKLNITTLSGSNTGDQTNITGNAGTATKLQTARTINGVAFDGTASVVINAQDSIERVASSLLGAVNGVATLDSNGLVPAIQLPSYVDDVVEASSLSSFPVTGMTGKIYVALDTNKTYRWSGSAYIYITSGAVDSVAGKTGIVTLVKADVGLSNVDNTSDEQKPVSILQANAIDNARNSVTSFSIAAAEQARQNAVLASAPIEHVGAGGSAHIFATSLEAGFMSASDKIKLDGIAAGATTSAGTLTSVTGTAPIVSSGGTAPVISITAASNVAPGSMSTADKIKLDAITGTNTGDETQASIHSKLSITTLSGSNTGDETTDTVKAKLGITTLTGVNTGDQTTITGNAGSATKLQTARTINGIAFDGTADITIATGSAGNTVSVINANTTAVNKTIYVIIGALTLTLPASPAVGDIIYFSNRSNTTAITIARNNNKIMGLDENMTIDSATGLGSLVYVDATRGWVLI